MDNLKRYKIKTDDLVLFSQLMPNICGFFAKGEAKHKIFGNGRIMFANSAYFEISFSNQSSKIFNITSLKHFTYFELYELYFDMMIQELVAADKKKQIQIGEIQLANAVRLVTSVPDTKNEWEAKESYNELSELDFKISSLWAGHEKSNEYTMARMISARIAEKIVIKFYQSLGHTVFDMSLTQISGSTCNDEWKLYDILLDEKKCIDVKNARVTVNSSSTYVEHCVSKFKVGRANKDVVIAGVLSPYVKFRDKNILGLVSGKSKIRYLGETTLTDINYLQKRFSRKIVKMSFDCIKFIPRWLFEYPSIYYEERNKNRKHFKMLIDDMLHSTGPSYGTLNLIPAYLSCGIKLPEIVEAKLKHWQVEFCNELIINNDSNITLPVLFLTLLTHFLEMVKRDEQCQEYDPLQYTVLLFSRYNASLPLGIVDPTGSIHQLIHSLNLLWSNREKTCIRSFEYFKFNGTGLLEGKKYGSSKYGTILAYCGGFVEGKGKCGNAPLILGMHESCLVCGKLICEKCGHGSSNCEECERRIKNISQASNDYAAQDYPDLDNEDNSNMDFDIS